MIVLVQVVNTPWDICRIQRCYLGWKMYPVNKECRRRSPCCWYTYLLNMAFVMRLHRHKCTHVGKRFEHRSMCTTPVVLRCSRSIHCRNFPIHGGIHGISCCRASLQTIQFYNLDILHCHQFRLFPPDISLLSWYRTGKTLLVPLCSSWHWMLVDIHQLHNYHR